MGRGFGISKSLCRGGDEVEMLGSDDPIAIATALAQRKINRFVCLIVETATPLPAPAGSGGGGKRKKFGRGGGVGSQVRWIFMRLGGPQCFCWGRGAFQAS